MLTRQIRSIVVHHSGTANGGLCTAEQIDEWHIRRSAARKLSFRERLNYRYYALGYHGVIYPSGFYQSGRHFDEWGDHIFAERRWNIESIGFCMIGDDRFTAEAWICLRNTIIATVGYLADQRGIFDAVGASPADAMATAAKMGLDILGHRDITPEYCPGFDVRSWAASGMVAPADGIL